MIEIAGRRPEFGSRPTRLPDHRYPRGTALPKRAGARRWSWLVIPALGCLLLSTGCQEDPSERTETDSSASGSPSSAGAPAPATPAAGGSADSTPGFHDVAEDAGIDVVTWAGGERKDHILESTGTGAAWLDYDEDGRLDLYVINAWLLDEEPTAVRIRGRNELYRNLGDGTFENVTEAAGVGDDAWGCGVCVGDIDNDGHLDLYVTNFGPNVLYRNRGDGTFEDVTAAAGVGDPGWGAGACFFDADRDGDQDLYVANYVDCTEDDVMHAERTLTWRHKAKVMVGPFGLRGGIDRYYRNNGDGTFTEATDEAGLTDTGEAYGLGVVASDLDNDGDVDLYVANDSNQNYLFRNDGSGHFSDIGGWCGAGFGESGAGQAGMGVDAGDYDGDGLFDIFVTNFTHDYSTLYRNEGDLFFTDVTGEQPLRKDTYYGLSWGCLFFDMDLDADVDLLIANGHIFPQVDDYPELEETYEQPLYLFRNDDGVFNEVTQECGPGMRIISSARGVAPADYDEDGDLDLLITAMDRRPLLLRNDMKRLGEPVVVRLRNRHGGPSLNALATLHAGGAAQVREVRSGTAYQSQGDFDLFFGLGSAARIDSLVVRWPNGKRTVHTDVAPGQRFEATEPTD